MQSHNSKHSMEEIKAKRKTGRPSKGDDARHILVPVRISNNDLKEITRIRCSSEPELKSSEIIYQRFKKGNSPIIKIEGLNKEDRRLLSYANNNLNQIARQFNAQNNAYISDKNQKLFVEIIEQLKRINSI